MMFGKRDVWFWLFLLGLTMPAAAISQDYLEYTTFQELTSLVPEASQPRPLNLTGSAFQLWAQGQLRLPAEGDWVEGDFDQDGQREAALIFQSSEGRFLLIADKKIFIGYVSGYLKSKNNHQWS